MKLMKAAATAGFFDLALMWIRQRQRAGGGRAGAAVQDGSGKKPTPSFSGPAKVWFSHGPVMK